MKKQVLFHAFSPKISISRNAGIFTVEENYSPMFETSRMIIGIPLYNNGPYIWNTLDVTRTLPYIFEHFIFHSKILTLRQSENFYQNIMNDSTQI